MNKVHISLNELETTSYKALESLQYDEGFCEALSKDVTFLEAVGLPGLSQFVEFLSVCKNTGHAEVHPVITRCDDKTGFAYECDCLNISCIHFIEPLVEYIISLVAKTPRLKVWFSNSYDYVFLLPYLQKFSPLPLSLEWENRKKGTHNLAFLFPDNEYPQFFSNVTENIQKQHHPTLVAYASVEDAQSAQQMQARIYVHDEEQTCARCFEQSLAHGLLVNSEQWEVIQNFEKAVLVPSNATSRGGAGAAAQVVDAEDLLFKKI